MTGSGSGAVSARCAGLAKIDDRTDLTRVQRIEGIRGDIAFHQLRIPEPLGPDRPGLIQTELIIAGQLDPAVLQSNSQLIFCNPLGRTKGRPLRAGLNHRHVGEI